MLEVNLRHLEAHNVRLEGELDVEELDIDTQDEMIQLTKPLKYALEVQKLEGALLVQGQLRLELGCQCVRCLKPFRYELNLEHWTAHLPLPYVREDILLEFPQHPLCEPECGGLPGLSLGKAKHPSGAGQPAPRSTAWDELNKLKF
jgi:uncharacterized metal-binding protein YceD (DUF177 family)